jgi:hypothetical protein
MEKSNRLHTQTEGGTMSIHWMKHALIASILTVLMTLPATAQRRRPSGPAPRQPANNTPAQALQKAPLVKVRFGNQTKTFPTLVAAYADLLNHRLRKGDLARVKIIYPSVAKDQRSPVASGPRGSANTPSFGAPQKAPSLSQAPLTQVEPKYRVVHERVMNHRFRDIPTKNDLMDIESLLPPISEKDQFLIDKQLLQNASMESIQAAMEDLKNIALGQGEGWIPAAMLACAAVATAVQLWDSMDEYGDYGPKGDLDGDGIPNNVDGDIDGDGRANEDDSEPYDANWWDSRPGDNKKSEGEGNIIAEKDSPMMLMEKMQVLRYDLLRQYQLHNRLNR